MDYLRFANTEWVDTGIPCQRCGNKILRESFRTGKPTDHFACSRIGCTYPNDIENIRKLIALDSERVCYNDKDINLF